MDLKAVGNRLIVRLLKLKDIQEKQSSLILDSTLDKPIAEGVIMSVGELCKNVFTVGMVITFEANALRFLQTPRVPQQTFGTLFEEDVYAIIEGIPTPNIPELTHE